MINETEALKYYLNNKIIFSILVGRENLSGFASLRF